MCRTVSENSYFDSYAAVPPVRYDMLVCARRQEWCSKGMLWVEGELTYFTCGTSNTSPQEALFI
jgi:hypothetical protein